MQLMREFVWEDVLRLEKSEGQEELVRTFESCGAKLTTLSSFMTQLYQHCTLGEMSLPQKLYCLNLARTGLRHITSSHSREEMDQYLRQPLPAFKCPLSQPQLTALTDWMRPRLIQHYELYDTVLDSNPHFVMTATPLTIVPTAPEQQLSQGTVIEVEEIAALEEFVGVRPPKEEKKDPKKK